MAEKELTLPRMGETMDEGTIVAWLKQPGELFQRGDTLLEVESDKTNVEIPALEDGEMVRHLVSPGEKVAVDRPIAVVKTLGTGPSVSTEAQPILQANVAPEQKIENDENRSAPAATTKLRASPVARRTAKRLGIDLAEVRGTAPKGRITGTDVQQHNRLWGDPARSPGDPSGQSRRWGTQQRGTWILLHGLAVHPTR